MIKTDTARTDRAGGAPREIPTAKWRPGCLMFSGTVFVLLVTGGWAVIQVGNSREEANYRNAVAAIAARGEPLRFADLEPDPLPPEQDGTPYYRRASDLLEQLSRTEPVTIVLLDQGSLAAASGTQRFLDTFSAADQTAIKDTLAQTIEVRAQLALALERGQMRLAIDYADPLGGIVGGVEDNMTHRNFVRLLVMECVDGIAAGDADAATKVLLDLHRLTRLSAEEEDLAGWTTAATSLDIAHCLAQSLLEELSLNAEQRERIDQALVETQASIDVRQVVIRDRGEMFETMEAAALSGEGTEFLMSDDSVEAELNRWCYARIAALRFRDLTKWLQIQTRRIEIVAETGPDALRAAAALDDEAQGLAYSYMLSRESTPLTSSTLNGGLRARQQLNALRLAIRVDEYYRRLRRFPATLEEVLDEQLTEVPLGMYSHLPPQLSVNPGGFSIIDVGADRQQNGDTSELGSAVEIRYRGPSAQNGPEDQER